MPDGDGYPTEEELSTVETWSYKDFRGLLDCVEDLWRYADCGYWREKNDVYRISAGGWSGNEEIIGALMANRMFWACCWWSSRRGGHYVFKIPKLKEKQ